MRGNVRFRVRGLYSSKGATKRIEKGNANSRTELKADANASVTREIESM